MTDITPTQYFLEQSVVEGIIDLLRRNILLSEVCFLEPSNIKGITELLRSNILSSQTPDQIAKSKIFLEYVDYQDQESGYERVVNKDGSTKLREKK